MLWKMIFVTLPRNLAILNKRRGHDNIYIRYHDVPISKTVSLSLFNNFFCDLSPLGVAQ